MRSSLVSDIVEVFVRLHFLFSLAKLISQLIYFVFHLFSFFFSNQYILESTDGGSSSVVGARTVSVGLDLIFG